MQGWSGALGGQLNPPIPRGAVALLKLNSFAIGDVSHLLQYAASSLSGCSWQLLGSRWRVQWALNKQDMFKESKDIKFKKEFTHMYYWLIMFLIFCPF